MADISKERREEFKKDLMEARLNGRIRVHDVNIDAMIFILNLANRTETAEAKVKELEAYRDEWKARAEAAEAKVEILRPRVEQFSFMAAFYDQCHLEEAIKEDLEKTR